MDDITNADEAKKKLLVDFLMQKYPEKFADIQAQKQTASEGFDKSHPEMGMGGNLLLGLRAAMKNDASYDDLKKQALEQRTKERTAALLPFEEQEKGLESQFKAGTGALDVGEKIKKAGREDVTYTRGQKEFEVDSDESKEARQTVADNFPNLAKTVDGKTAAEINKAMPWLTTKIKQDFEASQKELDRASAERIKVNARAATPSKSIQAADRDYAKRYNTFTQGGSANARAAIENLEGLARELEGDTGTGESGGGRFKTLLPDAMRSRAAIRRRDSARNFANTTLKELFGGQLSDAERDAAAKEYWIDALGNEDNAKILRRKVKTLRKIYENEISKAKHFEKFDTVDGWEAPVTDIPKDGYSYEGAPPPEKKKPVEEMTKEEMEAELNG
jgi:hypothetical protein